MLEGVLMISTTEVQPLLKNGGAVYGSDGDKIGKIGQVFLDNETGQPEWVTVRTGLFGTGESFVPLSQGSISGDDIRVPFDKHTVKDAPRVDDADGHLSPEEESKLYEYYGMTYGSGGDDARVSGDDTRTDRTGQEGIVGRDTSGPTTDDAMTRSEERLQVGTESVPAGTARLRKYVVTENVTRTVPVSHEEVRLEREPVTDANRDAALSGPDLTSEEHAVTLNEERVVTNKETVPVERVRLGTETVTEERQVDEQVAKEQIDLDDSQVEAKHAR
jgi:uncharacterized protein (TIGR02271 family)